MPKSICVYLHDANPAIDSHHFRISRTEADARLAAGYVRYLSPNAVQLNPPPGWSPDQTPQMVCGLFNEAWKVRPSAHYLVWQMRSTASDPEAKK